MPLRDMRVCREPRKLRWLRVKLVCKRPSFMKHMRYRIYNRLAGCIIIMIRTIIAVIITMINNYYYYSKLMRLRGSTP